MPLTVNGIHRCVEGLDLREENNFWSPKSGGQRKPKPLKRIAHLVLISSACSPGKSRLRGKRNGGERNQTLAAVIANHPFTNAFVEAFPQSCLQETMSDQPNRRPNAL